MVVKFVYYVFSQMPTCFIPAVRHTCYKFRLNVGVCEPLSFTRGTDKWISLVSAANNTYELLSCQTDQCTSKCQPIAQIATGECEVSSALNVAYTIELPGPRPQLQRACIDLDHVHPTSMRLQLNMGYWSIEMWVLAVAILVTAVGATWYIRQFRLNKPMA